MRILGDISDCNVDIEESKLRKCVRIAKVACRLYIFMINVTRDIMLSGFIYYDFDNQNYYCEFSE